MFEGTLGGGQTKTITMPVPWVDEDGDGIPNELDQCSGTPTGEVVDDHGCSISQLMPCAGPVSGGAWKNHGQYVSSVAHQAEEFLAAGLITSAQKDAIVSAAAQSDCGRVKVTPQVRRENGKIGFRFAGQSGQHYVVQASTNLVDWTTLGEATDTGNSQFNFEDSINLPYRFYRIVAR